MSIDPEELQKYNEHAGVKEVLQGGKQKGRNSLASEILSQDQYKQNIVDGLLRIQRQKIPMTDEETGETILQEFVRLENGTGQWKKVSDISDKEWEEMKSGGVVNEEGAEEILTHLQSVSNNNISLSNLTKKQINDIGRNSTLSLQSKLINNKEQYGIDSTDDIEWVLMSIIVPNVQGSLNKAKNGSLVGELLRETKLVGSLDDQDEEKSGGLLSFN